MRLNPKKTKSTVESRFQIYAAGYGDLTLCGAELGEVQNLRILGATLDSKLTFETNLREVVRKHPEVWVSCAKQKIYLNVHVCSKYV